MNGAPEAAQRALHVAGRDQRPDPGRGDGLAVDLDQRHDAGLELLACGEHLRVALRLGAEAEVLADRDPARRRARSTRIREHEVLGGDRGELLVEGDHDQLLDPEPLDHVALDLERHDQLRRGRRVEHAAADAGRR